jgi:hypothetical protein
MALLEKLANLLYFAAFSMKEVVHVPIAPGRKMGAWVCLVAALLLWAPIWAMAFQASGMGCCTGGLCPAHGRHKANQATNQQSAPAETPMECEHHGDTGQQGAMKCSMSCCEESTDALMAAAIFILPETTAISVLTGSTVAPIELTPTEFMQSIRPPSPPPRFFNVLL